MKLRENQIGGGVEFFRTPKMKPSIIVISVNRLEELGEKILVLQPSKELLEQNYNKFITLGGEASIYSFNGK